MQFALANKFHFSVQQNFTKGTTLNWRTKYSVSCWCIALSTALLDDLDKELNNYVMRAREWYGWHFPELSKIVTDNIAFARTVMKLGMLDSLFPPPRPFLSLTFVLSLSLSALLRWLGAPLICIWWTKYMCAQENEQYISAYLFWSVIIVTRNTLSFHVRCKSCKHEAVYLWFFIYFVFSTYFTITDIHAVDICWLSEYWCMYSSRQDMMKTVWTSEFPWRVLSFWSCHIHRWWMLNHSYVFSSDNDPVKFKQLLGSFVCWTRSDTFGDVGIPYCVLHLFLKGNGMMKAKTGLLWILRAWMGLITLQPSFRIQINFREQ